MNSFISRRHFVQFGSACLVAPLGTIATRKRSTTRSLEKLRTAHIGVGGMGGSDLKSVASHENVEVAGLCDVDSKILIGAKAKHPGAKTFSDFREMITTMGDSIDAVVVSTPDHTHAPAAMTAMLAGKPVYCQKPLTHEVFESRQLRLFADKQLLVTQMGVQIHSRAVYKRAVRMIQDGVIGKVSQVHAWSNKNWGYDGPEFEGSKPPPENLNWDLWLGTAPQRAYVPKVYHRANWRKIVDFGTGTLGDMGVHIFDTPYTALELTAPNWAKTTCRPPTGVGHPEKNIVEYEFPGTNYTTDTMVWKWYDGSYAPPKAADVGLPAGTKLPKQGSLFIGETGQMMLPHIGEAVLFPEANFKDYQRPNIADDNHYHQWVDACLGDGKTSMSFDLAGPLTEALLLGVVANRFPNQKLAWDAKNLKVTNVEAANSLIKRTYRKGFEVDPLAKVSSSLVPTQ
jgi:predicted dehydrogenase